MSIAFVVYDIFYASCLPIGILGRMSLSRKGCFKCGNLGHIADACPSETRLCYNCREVCIDQILCHLCPYVLIQAGHESADCPSPKSASARQCYSCGGVGHVQAECPSIRIAAQNVAKENIGGAAPKCYVRPSFRLQ